MHSEMTSLTSVVRADAVAADFMSGGEISIAKIVQKFNDIDLSVDVFFVLFSGYLVFFMQAGFALLTAGSVRSKNTKNVLLKNMYDAALGIFAYYSFGWAFAYGPSANKFIGWGNFALSSDNGLVFTDFYKFFFQWAFAAAAASIVTGSVAERTTVYAYLAYAFFLVSFVYPVVSHWVWGGGWLSTLFDKGAIDFAGCLVVHMVGGFAGLTGAIIVGPRIGRFDSEGKVVPIPGHSATLTTLGTFLLWFGWYGFNPGSALGVRGVLRNTVQRCVLTTTLSAGAGGVTTLVILKLRDGIFDLIGALNGILAGLVAITASCAFVEPYCAIVIGIVAAFVYVAAAMALIALKIDDPLEAFPVHGAVGMWGAIAVGLFNRRVHMETAGLTATHQGLFYGGGALLGCQLIAIIVVAAWTVLLIGALFLLLKTFGILRLSPEHELLGNDVSKHGGSAYPADDILHAATKKRDFDGMVPDNSINENYGTGV